MVHFHDAPQNTENQVGNLLHTKPQHQTTPKTQQKTKTKMDPNQKRRKPNPRRRVNQDLHHPTHTGCRNAHIECPLWREGYGEPKGRAQ